MITKRQLADELIRLRSIARFMSNLCYNIAQNRGIPNSYREPAEELYKEFDGIQGLDLSAYYGTKK